MKAAIVSLSDIGKYNRMDAEFHIAVAEAKEAITSLEKEFSEDTTKSLSDAIAEMKELPIEALRPLARLIKGRRTFNHAEAESLIEEYPYVCLVLIRQNAGEAINYYKSEQSKIDAKIQKLNALIEKK
jgi:3-methyladenine DNA glycosylase AlkD